MTNKYYQIQQTHEKYQNIYEEEKEKGKKKGLR